MVGLLGPNGAGKTTIFYLITGLIHADYGTITLDGHDITRLPMYRRARLGIGYLPQEASIFRGLTAEENIRAAAELVEPDAAHCATLVDAKAEARQIVAASRRPPAHGSARQPRSRSRPRGKTRPDRSFRPIVGAESGTVWAAS